MTKLISKLKIMVVLVLSLSCSNIALADQAKQPTQEELKNAEQLFQRNNIALDETKDETLKIIRYHETDLRHIIVLCDQFYKGLPVIHGEIAFHFGKPGKFDSISGTRINNNYEFPVDLVPGITEFEALKIEINSRDYQLPYRGRTQPRTYQSWTSSRNNQQQLDEEVNRVWHIYKDPNYKGSLKIILGIYNKNGGTNLKPLYVLVWSVGGVIIDAQSGEIYYREPIWID